MSLYPCLFELDANGLATEGLNPKCLWVANDGIAFQKFVGRGARFKEGKIWKLSKPEMYVDHVNEGIYPVWCSRGDYHEDAEEIPQPDLKKGNEYTAYVWEPVDPLTYIDVARSKRLQDENRPYLQAFEYLKHYDAVQLREGATFELCGPGIRDNPENMPVPILIPHRCSLARRMTFSVFRNLPRDYAGLKEWFLEHQSIEGVVWHHYDENDSRRSQLTLAHFGLTRTPKKQDDHCPIESLRR